MENIFYDSIVKQSILASIEREELLLIKYEDYEKTIKDDDFNVMLKEFEKSSKRHIDLLKSKLQKLSS